MVQRNQLLSPIFIISLTLLLLNDCYLKQAFPSPLTGKLSDFAGLLVFPIFIAFVLPKTKKWIALVTGLLFLVWKTPLASPMIELLNQFIPFEIQRIIDYSDYWALLVLPIAHVRLNRTEENAVYPSRMVQIAKLGLASVAFFAICATSMPRSEVPNGTIYIGEEYTIKKSKQETIQMIKSLGYNVNYYENLADSSIIRKFPWKIPYYQTDNVVIYDDLSKPIDTILHIKYTLREVKAGKTTIGIINVTLSEDGNIQRWQTLKYLSKQYKKGLKKQLIEKLQQ